MINQILSDFINCLNNYIKDYINIFNKETSLNYILKSYDVYSDFDFYNQVAKWYINNNIKKNNYSKELLLMIEKNIKKNIDTQQCK